MATHKELITAGKFDEKFKRALLNYYSYGFKNLGSYDAKKRQTLSEDWLRLNRVILNYMEWSNDRQVRFASTDSQSMDENPFHRVYRFCKYKPLIYPAYFLHTLAALSPFFELREGLEALELDDDRRIRLEDIIGSRTQLKTSDLICFYSDSFAPSEGDDKNKTPNNRLDDLAAIGVLACKQKDGMAGGKGDRWWSLPELTMRKLAEAGEAADADFTRHLSSALDFFSGYYLFGEVGTFLRDRLCAENISPFRFKHEYFMQSLNDFNIMDLLYAIENGKWCKIRYSHGIADFSEELLCYPIEIRISNMQGREFLMFYEPFRRSYTALRIEFIDSIEYYDDKKIKAVLVRAGVHSSPEAVDADIANAKVSMQYSWGVATTKTHDRNAVEPIEPHPVSLRIAYDPATEYYIANRLKRECRSGTVAVSEEDGSIRFSIKIPDEVELRPWMRSFYSRILSCEGMDTDTFSLNSDVEKVVETILQDKIKQPKGQKKPKDSDDRWRIPASVQHLLGNGTKAREHDMLFSEVFSIYYYIIADVFVQLCCESEDGKFSESDIDAIIRRSFSKYYIRAGEETEDLLPTEIKNLLTDGGFLRKTTKASTTEYEFVRKKSGVGFDYKPKEINAYLSKYKCSPGIEMYRDVVPLSKMEIRWLKTVMNDPAWKIRMFLSDSEMKAINDLLNQYATELPPIPMDKVKYFDRFHFPKEESDREARVLPVLLEGIYDQKTVRIKYQTMKNQFIVGEFCPIILEFSKRNNRFQGFFRECGSDNIRAMNISQIITVAETNTSFDYSAAEQALISFREQDTTSVEIEFYDVRNLADRILTEFSPWKKRCSYDPENELYTLTIFYQQQDETDIVVRLLGFGATIRFPDKEHPIYTEIRARMTKQMKLIREQQSHRSNQESEDNR